MLLSEHFLPGFTYVSAIFPQAEKQKLFFWYMIWLSCAWNTKHGGGIGNLTPIVHFPQKPRASYDLAAKFWQYSLNQSYLFVTDKALVS